MTERCDSTEAYQEMSMSDAESFGGPRGSVYSSPGDLGSCGTRCGAVSNGSRQKRILQLVAEGRTTAEIAEMTGIVAKTVNNHLGAVYQRLGCRNLTQAVLKAARLGIIELP